MDWIMEPMTGFNALMPRLAEAECTGGATLNECSCQAGLVSCQCSGGLKQTKLQEN